MKRILAVLLAGLMLLSLAACGEKEDEATWKLGAVQTEGNFEHNFEHALGDHGNGAAGFDFVMYDNLNAALMSLNRKDINALSVDKVTGDYIAAHNSDYISIGVTGDVPPMDFVASNGKAAGFNIALLTEIANRAQVNFEIVQIETGARAMALSSNKVDAVFWTKSVTCTGCGATGAEKIEGTLVTESYFSDTVAGIRLKAEK